MSRGNDVTMVFALNRFSALFGIFFWNLIVLQYKSICLSIRDSKMEGVPLKILGRATLNNSIILHLKTRKANYVPVLFLSDISCKALHFQLCWRQCTRMIYLICFQCFLMGYISLEWYLLHCVLQNDHSLCRLKIYLRSTMGQQRFSNIALINIERACTNSSQQWRGSHHWYLRPSKCQRRLFLWTRFMSSYDRLICKNIFTSYVGLCCCILWPTFLFDCGVKMWATCEDFLGKWFTAPLAKNVPCDFEISLLAGNLLSST